MSDQLRDGTAIGPGILQAMAPAKVNLFLEILGRRPDGYHELETFLVQVGLFDTLCVEETVQGELALKISSPEESPRDPCKPLLSCGRENLVWRAAELLRQHAGCQRGAKLRLIKRIPIAAGLGGGSSDAAATLRLLNHLWQLGLSPQELTRLAAHLGSDVPFFLNGTAAWCRGRGELVEPVPWSVRCWFLLISPLSPVSTVRVYAQVCPPQSPRSSSAFDAALRQGDVLALRNHLFNRLEEAALRAYPQLHHLRKALDGCGLSHARLSGSGGTFFALFASAEAASQAAEQFRRHLSQTGSWPVRIIIAPSLTASES